MWSADCDDSALVNASLKGDRDAFTQIVARYQALVASVAYSATGNLAQSEDLAQETFIAAWEQLQTLREPQKLRSWLCGIARHFTANALRRQQRQPLCHAESLESAAEMPGADALPADRAMTQEEETILWRSLEQIPGVYREPLILFYREHQSVAHVAQALELSEEATRQRLSRGRKLLEERIASFVEGALRHSAPGPSFTVAVMAALPPQMATIGFTAATAAKGGAAVKAAAWLTFLNLCASLLPGSLAAYLGYQSSIAEATTDEERRGIRRFYSLILLCIVLSVALAFVAVWAAPLANSHPGLYVALVIATVLSWLPPGAVLILWIRRAIATGQNLKEPLPQSFPRGATPVAYEFRSRASFLGLPLLHIRFGSGFSISKHPPVKAWIALGDVAIGGIFAGGGVALAPIAIGGFALGLALFGGFGAGVLCYAGFGLGIWSLGGLVAGLQSVGGCALGWTAALGGIAVARQFALGGVAVAAHANDAAAHVFITNSLFCRCAYLLLTRWLWPTMLLATLPSVLLWLSGRRKRRK